MEKNDVEGVFLEAGIDWLTVVGFEQKTVNKMIDHSQRLLNWERDGGWPVKPWSMAGYQGYSCGGVQTGVRSDGCCVRLTSRLAQQRWLAFYQMAERATRIDVQYTYRPFDGPNKTLRRLHDNLKALQRQRKLTFGFDWREKSDGGRTLYIGSRNSPSFARVYNKGAQSDDPFYQDALRCEVQYNGNFADWIASEIAKQKFDQSAAYSQAFDWLGVRHCNCGKSLIDVDGHSVSREHLFISKAARQRPKERVAAESLAWLATQCRPTVERLIACGFRKEVEMALGIRILDVIGPDGPETKKES